MRIPEVKVKPGQLEKESGEVLVLTQYEDEPGLPEEMKRLDQALGGSLAELSRSGEFQGKLNQTVLLHTQGRIPSKRVLLVGLGKRKDARLDSLRQAMGSAVKRVRQAGVTSFSAPLQSLALSGISRLDLAQAMVEGAILGAYRFTAYRSTSDEDAKELQQMTLLPSNGDSMDDLREGAERGRIVAEAAAYVRDLCNHPANVITPSRLAMEAKTIAKERGVQVTVLERREMEKLGMGALLGVARGSHEPPKFIILEYQGQGRGTSGRGGRKGNGRPIVLVGKTITFDTGGISLKPADNMEQMKADMTGGAEVLAAVRAAARLRLPLHLVGILPATENMPGGNAMKPGDIVKTLSGKTVEVQNTDAEGRLILADGLAYAARYQPAALVDIDTLTGACAVALGQFAIGMLGNNPDLKQRIQQAGEKSGERVWEMPLWEDYFEQLKSDVADMRNIGGRGAGAITAALFLSRFAGDTPWVHLDIASTDWSDRERAYIPKGPTGIGARLLIQYLVDEAESAKQSVQRS